MSKYLILCNNPKKLGKLVTNKEKYTVTDSVEDDTCDVIFVSKLSNVTEADLDMIANMLETRKVIVGVSQKKSGLKKFIYKFFGASHGENCLGIVGIPREFISKLEITTKIRAISIIKNAETKKLPIIELPLSKSELRRRFTSFIGDLYSLFLESQPLKYIFSSGVAFLIDYTIFLTLDSFLNIGFAKLEICTFTAWIVSSLINFFVNRVFVFRSNAPVGPAFIEYYSLAAVVFFMKTLLLELFTRVLHIPEEISKLIAEVVFFTSNYFIQKFFIFKKKKDKPKQEENPPATSEES